MTAPDEFRVLSAAEVAAGLDYPSLIDRLETAFRTGAEVPLRHRHDLPGKDGAGGTMLIKPAWRDGGPVAVKIVNIFPGNAARGLPALHGTVLLCDGATGIPLAAIEGQSLTNRRTAAASALAARYLARADAQTHLVVGAGQIAAELARALPCVRPIRRTLVWARKPDQAKAFADALAAEGHTADPVSDLPGAVGQADIVSCATLATEPLVRGEWLRPGVHLDLVGAFRPDMREVDDEAVLGCRLFVDTRDGALAEAGDLTQPLAAGLIAPDDVAGDLADLCAGRAAGRGGPDELTLFKSVGTALEDLVAAELVWDRAAK